VSPRRRPIGHTHVGSGTVNGSTEAPPQESSDVLGGRVERAAFRALLAERDFRNLFWAMLTSSLGDWIGVFAILALTEGIVGATRAGAFALSGVMVARVLPTMILGPVAGVFVDRWDRKRTLIWTDIGRGVVMFLIAFSGDIFQLVVATFLIEVMSTLFAPAKDATLPNLVPRERLVEANQLNLIATYGTLPIGAAIFAALVGLSNTIFTGDTFLAGRSSALAIWINALTFFVSAVFIMRIRIPRNGPRASVAAGQDEPGAWQELREGFRFIATQPLIRALIVGVMAAFLAAGVVASGVGKLFATILNTGDSGFGILGFAVGAGLFLGLLSASRLSRRWGTERLFAPGLALAGGALIVTAFSPRLDLAVVPAFAMGAGAGLAFVTGYTLLQQYSDDEIRGRTFAAFNTGVRAALFASLVVGPFLVGVFGIERFNRDLGAYPYSIGGVRLTLVIGGLVALAGAVWTGRAVHSALMSHRAADLALTERAVAVDRPGLFVVFEGGEGAGKTTQIRLLRAAVERAGHEVVTTREPGGTPLGERIRNLLLDRSSAGMADRTEALLYAAARAQHVDEVIRPALEDGRVVLCDRFVDSSVVYQGEGRELGADAIEELNRWGTGDVRPDLVIVLDVDAAAGLGRAGSEPDRLESAGLDFHQRVNEGFRRRASADTQRYLLLDGTRPAEDISREVREAVLARIEAKIAEQRDRRQATAAGVDQPDASDVPPPVAPAGPVPPTAGTSTDAHTTRTIAVDDTAVLDPHDLDRDGA
jgi:dTMP kinase